MNVDILADAKPARLAAEAAGELLPGRGGELQGYTVTVGGVADEDLLSAGHLYAAAAVRAAVRGLAPLSHASASLSKSATDSDTR